MSDTSGISTPPPQAQAPQVTQPSDMSGIQTALQLANQNFSQFLRKLAFVLPAQAAYNSYLAISNSSLGGTTVAMGSGAQASGRDYLVAISVTVACTASSSIAGKIYDANSPATVTSSNLMALIPSSGTQVYNYPFVNGLTIQPSSISTQTVSVYFINQSKGGAY